MPKGSLPSDVEDPYDFFRRADVVAEYAGFDFLTPPERLILEISRPLLSGGRMLDIGVGAGRTAFHFAPLAASYVGIDVAEEMIAACRRRFEHFEGQATFKTGDVRDLTGFDDSEFDGVLFSFNGLDTVGDHFERALALNEMARVLRPGGLLALSCNNLGYARWSMSFPATVLARFRWYRSGLSLLRPRNLKRLAIEARRWRRHNRHLPRQPYAMVVEQRPRYELDRSPFETPSEQVLLPMYWSLPSEQLRQLRSVGFKTVRTLAPDGSDVTGLPDRQLARWRWLYHVAQRQ
ncbi:MAG TPA: class I SAM-dependent methyltransferase [Acidimicrobiia bacterium]|nr:class I SAM-dependent methyltransferase [Acidimicrobiia bacterium]